jgi:hypothetical protein
MLRQWPLWHQGGWAAMGLAVERKGRPKVGRSERPKVGTKSAGEHPPHQMDQYQNKGDRKWAIRK